MRTRAISLLALGAAAVALTFAAFVWHEADSQQSKDAAKIERVTEIATTARDQELALARRLECLNGSVSVSRRGALIYYPLVAQGAHPSLRHLLSGRVYDTGDLELDWTVQDQKVDQYLVTDSCRLKTHPYDTPSGQQP